ALAPVAAARDEELRRAAQFRKLLGRVAAVVLVLALGGGVAVWLRAEQVRQETERLQHEAELAKAVEADLERAERAQEEKKWPEAQAALVRAEGRLTRGGGGKTLRDRVGRAQDDLARILKDQEMVARLEEARLQSAATDERGSDYKGGARLFQKAFAWYGLDPWGTTPEVAAARIEASPIRDRLVTALDQWGEALPAARRKDFERLARIAGLADSHDRRRQLREAVLRKDWGVVREMAGGTGIPDLPPSSLTMLSDALKKA